MKQETQPPFPDLMTFREMFLGLFNRDFLTDLEFNTICDAAEMYANGCVKNARPVESDAVAAELAEKERQIEQLREALEYCLNVPEWNPSAEYYDTQLVAKTALENTKPINQ